MGLEGHTRGVLEKNGIFANEYRWSTYSLRNRSQIIFRYKQTRDLAYTVLRQSGEFNPYKVGKLILRFDVVPQFGGKMRPYQR